MVLSAPKEQPEVSERTAQRERLAQTALRERLVRPAPGAHWVLLEQLVQPVVSVPREYLAQLELAVPKERPAHWAQRGPEVRWGPPVHQGRKERLGRPVASVRTEPGECLAQRVPPTMFEAYSVLRARLAQRVLRERLAQAKRNVAPTARRGPAESLSGQIVQRALPRKTRWRPAGGEACRGRPSRAGQGGRRRGRWLGAA